MKTIIILCGKPTVGKTTVRKAIQKLGATGASTSSALISKAAVAVGVGVDEIIAKKEVYRPLLVALGDAIVHDQPDRLVQLAIESAQSLAEELSKEERIFKSFNIQLIDHKQTINGLFVIDGVRRCSEITAARERNNVVAVWIDRPGSATIKDNTESALEKLCDCTLTMQTCDEVIIPPELLQSLINRGVDGYESENFTLLPNIPHQLTTSQ